MLRQHGTHLKVVYDSEQYDYGAHEVLEEWTCLYFVLDGMFELRLIMRFKYRTLDPRSIDKATRPGALKLHSRGPS